jgi:hypothetical protein
MTEIKHRLAKYGADVVPIATFLVNYKDIFSFSYLYTLMHEWLVEEGYAPREDSEFPEVYYLERQNPVAGNEFWIRWRTAKKPYNTSLWLYFIDIDIHAFTMKKAELILAGKKYEVDKGEIEVNIAANLITDPDKKLEAPLLRQFKRLVLRGIFRKRWEDHKNALYRDVFRLQEAVKTYLKLETYLPEKELAEYWMRRPEVK